MRDFWVTFTGKQRSGSARAENIDVARTAVEAKYGEAVRTIDPIPYPAFPTIYWSGPREDSFAPRCSAPTSCKGKNGCQRRPSCTE